MMATRGGKKTPRARSAEAMPVVNAGNAPAGNRKPKAAPVAAPPADADVIVKKRSSRAPAAGPVPTVQAKIASGPAGASRPRRNRSSEARAYPQLTAMTSVLECVSVGLWL